MDRDFYRQWKDHPVRSILGGAANGRLPTESDLANLDVPDITREQVRDLCADLKEREATQEASALDTEHEPQPS